MIEIRQGNQLGEAGFPFSVFIVLVGQHADAYGISNIYLRKSTAFAKF